MPGGSSFRFGSTHSDTLGLIVKAKSRPILPPLRTVLEYIPGRSGSIEMGGLEYNDRIIELECSLTKGSLTGLRNFLNNNMNIYGDGGPSPFGTGTQYENLVFDDEPGFIYKARMLNQVDLDQTSYSGSFILTFTCFPFRYGSVGVSNSWSVPSNTHFTNLYYYGSYTTPFNLQITNPSGTVVTPSMSVVKVLSDYSYAGERCDFLNMITVGSSGYLNIDSTNFKAFSSVPPSTTPINQLPNITTTFFTLYPGNNYFKFVNMSGCTVFYEYENLYL